ncbi:hypothetical protein C8Q80DRAFT_1196183 [Daedaleopsis nitida]|nr:hypothetical protein C8Q80DRAFT_1196183 [Daedaleopsis nitida]
MHPSVAPQSEESDLAGPRHGRRTSDRQSYSTAVSYSTHPYHRHFGTTSPAPFSSTYQAAGEPPDVVFVTRDQTQLYTHSRQLHHVSANAWGGLLTSLHCPTTFTVSEDAQTTQLVLHVVYDLPCLHLAPTLETMERVLEALLKYGVAVQHLAAPHTPLYQLLLAHAPSRPIETYALASQYQLEPVTVATSTHLLAFNMLNISDELVEKMGAIYFKRLLDFHAMRRAALKAIILRPPPTHHPTDRCGGHQDRKLRQIWAFGVAALAWGLIPSLSVFALQSAFENASMDQLTCVECRSMLQQRVQEVTTEWAAVPRTI